MSEETPEQEAPQLTLLDYINQSVGGIREAHEALKSAGKKDNLKSLSARVETEGVVATAMLTQAIAVILNQQTEALIAIANTLSQMAPHTHEPAEPDQPAE